MNLFKSKCFVRISSDCRAIRSAGARFRLFGRSCMLPPIRLKSMKEMCGFHATAKLSAALPHALR